MLTKESLQKMLIEKQKEVDNLKKALQNLIEDENDEADGTENMVDWDTKDVSNWFESLGINIKEKIEEYQVDGLLLLNMQRDELSEFGIKSSIQLNKVEIKLRDYRKKHISRYGEDAILPSIDDSKIFDLEETASKPRSTIQTEEYFSKQIICFGDGNQPKDGDIVQMHYTIQIKDERTNVVKVIECSRTRGHPFEFVLGKGQVIVGLEKAIQVICCGERSSVVIPFVHAYGKEGIPPAIPPESDLICDVELLSFRKQPRWFKPFIQSPGLCQIPYEELEHKE